MFVNSNIPISFVILILKYFVHKSFSILLQNGYPSRRRSLVDDARFETIVVKQTKQSVLEEAREKANGKSLLIVFCMKNI